MGAGAVATRFGFTAAFVGAGVLIIAGAALVLALRSISSRTRVAHESPPDAAGEG